MVRRSSGRDHNAAGWCFVAFGGSRVSRSGEPMRTGLTASAGFCFEGAELSTAVGQSEARRMAEMNRCQVFQADGRVSREPRLAGANPRDLKCALSGVTERGEDRRVLLRSVWWISCAMCGKKSWDQAGLW